MSEPSIHTILNESFPKSGKDAWHRIASQELGEKNQIENLIWKIGGLRFYPYYAQEDLQNLPPLKNYQSHHRQGWGNLPKVTVSAEKDANERALKYLTGGADGVLFDVTGCIDFNINHLLDRITWPYCNISFLSSPDTKIATKILAYAAQNKYDLSQLDGSVFWTTLPADGELRKFLPFALKKYHTLGITISPSSAVQEISKSLEQCVKLMDTLTDLGMEKDVVFRNISLSFSAEDNFLMNAAKFKVVRMLWFQLSQAFEIPHYVPDDLHIHVCSEKSDTASFQPHVNMIKNTTHALSAILGGCNALTLCADSERDDMTNRIALNVSNIFKEESHLDKVADAAAGSYALENIVYELAQVSWKEFQNSLRS